MDSTRVDDALALVLRKKWLALKVESSSADGTGCARSDTGCTLCYVSEHWGCYVEVQGSLFD